MGWVSQHAIIWFIVVASEIDILLCTQTTIELRRHLKISAAKAVWPKFVYQSVTFDRIVSVRFQIRLTYILHLYTFNAQTWQKRLSLGCVNSLPTVTRIQPGHGITQPTTWLYVLSLSLSDV